MEKSAKNTLSHLNRMPPLRMKQYFHYMFRGTKVYSFGKRICVNMNTHRKHTYVHTKKFLRQPKKKKKS